MDTGVIADAKPPAPDVVDAPPIAASCVASKTTELASTGDPIDQIAIDDAYVYFHDEKRVARVPKGGGKVETLATPLWRQWPDMSAFLLTAGDIVWSEIAAGPSTNIFRVPKQGGAKTTVLTETGNMFYGLSVAPNDDYYFWGGTATNVTLMLVTPKGATTPLPAVPWYTRDVAQSGGVIYAVADTGVFALGQDNLFHALIQASFGQAGLWTANNLQFDATTVYFWGASEVNQAFILSVPKTGGQQTVLDSGPETTFGQFVTTGGLIYFAMRLQNQIMRMNTDGSAKTVVASGPKGGQALGVAVDDLCVYWTSAAGPDGNHIFAAPK